MHCGAVSECTARFVFSGQIQSPLKSTGVSLLTCWVWRESSYFCGVKGHVSYLIEFRTAGPFVFWIAMNGGNKFNFPLWSACDRLLQRGAHKPLFPVLGWASAVKNSVLSGNGSLSWERDAGESGGLGRVYRWGDLWAKACLCGLLPANLGGLPW